MLEIHEITREHLIKAINCIIYSYCFDVIAKANILNLEWVTTESTVSPGTLDLVSRHTLQLRHAGALPGTGHYQFTLISMCEQVKKKLGLELIMENHKLKLANLNHILQTPSLREKVCRILDDIETHNMISIAQVETKQPLTMTDYKGKLSGANAEYELGQQLLSGNQPNALVRIGNKDEYIIVSTTDGLRNEHDQLICNHILYTFINDHPNLTADALAQQVINEINIKNSKGPKSLLDISVKYLAKHFSMFAGQVKFLPVDIQEKIREAVPEDASTPSTNNNNNNN